MDFDTCGLSMMVIHPFIHQCVLGSHMVRRFIQKVECSNHPIKCYCGVLEKLAKEHSNFVGRNGLTVGTIRHLSKGMKCAIKQHSTTGDSVALRKDLCNRPKHCFGDHQQCSASFCKKAGEGSGGKTILY